MQKRVRLLPTRVVIFFVLALALFEQSAYRQVWAKMIAGLGGSAGAMPSAGGLSRARRRVGAKPLRALFEAVCGPVGRPGTPGAFWRGLRTVALDGACVHVRDTAATGARYPKIRAAQIAYGYPLLRLTALIECGTRALIGAVFGPESQTEKDHARALLGRLGAGMLLLADAGYDDWRLMGEVGATGADYLFRSTAARTPLIMTELADGSYLSVLGYGRLPVRIVEAWITVTWADGTIHTQQWRLISSLLDPVAHPGRGAGHPLPPTLGDRNRLRLDQMHHPPRAGPALCTPRRHRPRGLRAALRLPGDHPHHRRRHRLPPRHRPPPSQLHHRRRDRPRPGRHRQRHHPGHPQHPDRRDRTRGTSQPAAPATTRQGPQPQIRHQQIRQKRRPVPADRPAIHTPHRSKDHGNGLDGAINPLSQRCCSHLTIRSCATTDQPDESRHVQPLADSVKSKSRSRANLGRGRISVKTNTDQSPQDPKPSIALAPPNCTSGARSADEHREYASRNAPTRAAT